MIAGGICSFPSIEAACNAVITTIQYGIPVARIELLDALQVRASIFIQGWICRKRRCCCWNFMALKIACANSRKYLARSRLNTRRTLSNGPPIRMSGHNYGKPGMMRFGRRWRCCPAGLASRLMSVCRFHVWPNVLKTPAVISKKVALFRRLWVMLAMAISIRCQLRQDLRRQSLPGIFIVYHFTVLPTSNTPAYIAYTVFQCP